MPTYHGNVNSGGTIRTQSLVVRGVDVGNELVVLHGRITILQSTVGGLSGTGTTQYLTQAAGDARYLQSFTVPSTYLTQAQNDLRYLQTVPSGYQTTTENDTRYLRRREPDYTVVHNATGFYEITFSSATQPIDASYVVLLSAETTALEDKFNLAYMAKAVTGFTVVAKDRDMTVGSSAVFTAPFGMTLKDLGFNFLCIRKGDMFCQGSIASDGSKIN